MPYDEAFFDAYRSELATDPIRRIHNEMFGTFIDLCFGNQYILDLGCGTCEFYKYTRHERKIKQYHGIDLNHREPDSSVTLGSYKSFPIHCPFKPTAFISVFSTELTMTVEKRYAFYKQMFAEFPTINYGMVSGFYYLDTPDDEVVESHGLLSYQTIEDAKNVRNDVFRELRAYVHAPSKIFGPYVIEVWKFFMRLK